MSQHRRQARLAGLLADLGRRPNPERPRAPRLDTIPAEAVERTLRLLDDLGGTTSEFAPLRPGAWDIVLSDGLIVELDEEQHFNRYRAITLAPGWCDGLPWTDDYRRYNTDHEDAARRKAARGGYWTSRSTEAMFGDPGEPGVLTGAGSPRWRQRALYDGMRDALAASGAVRLCRVAVWDEVGGQLLARVLDGRVDADLEDLAELVESRTR